MNKGGALTLYLQACRHALESNLLDPSSWTGGLDTSLLQLRQALTCSVCGKLLDVPMGPPESVCQHYICRGCIGGKTRFIRRTCGWCKEHSTFVPNTQLLSLVVCFRRLCQYLRSYLTPDPRQPVLGSTNPTEFIIREVAAEYSSPVGVSSKNSNSPLSPHFASPIFPSPLFVATSQPDLEDSVTARVRNFSCDSITMTDQKEEVCSSAAKKRKTKIDSLTKAEDLQPSTSLSSPNRSSQLRSAGFSPQSPRLSTAAQSSPCYAAVVTERSFEAGETSEMVEGENEDRSYVSENVVLSEHDYNKNILSTPPNTISGVSFSGAATVPSRGRFANRSDACRRSKKNNSAVVVETMSTTNFEYGSVAKKPKCATIRQIVEANQYFASDVSLSNEDERTTTSPANRSEGNVRSNKTKNVVNRTGCRCAMSKPIPGKLTCCGQRCPCYSAYKGCVDCKCRGCRNPRGDPRRIPASVHGLGYVVGNVLKRSPNYVGSGDSVGRVTLT